MKNSTKNYKDHISKVTEHQFDYKTDNMKVPTRFFMSEDLLPPERTFAQMEDVASNDCLYHHAAAMPDVMSKVGRKNASGTTIASERYILPQVNDSDPNCGMRVVRTDLNEDNISEEEIHMLFEQLVDTVPTKTMVGTKVPLETVIDICRGGTRPLIDYLGIETQNELTNSQNGGNFFDHEMSRQDILDTIPKLYLRFAQYRLGLIGAAGNHFFDLMKVSDIVDPDLAKKLKISKGQYLLMVHTGSGILGQYTMYTYTAKKREHLSQSLMVTLGRMTFKTSKKATFDHMQKMIKEHMHGDESLLKYDGNRDEGKMYMMARNAASNFGTANRATIIHNVAHTAHRVLGRKVEMDLLYDLPHISINKENHFGKDLWIHRSNTSRAYGPSRVNDHPVYSETGEPVFIPSSMSTDAYIGVGTDRNDESFYSAPHGTGKGIQPSEDSIPKNREELMKKMEDKGVRLYNARSSRTIEQDSSQYKDVSRVIEGVEENGVIKVVAKMKPVSVIMY